MARRRKKHRERTALTLTCSDLPADMPGVQGCDPKAHADHRRGKPGALNRVAPWGKRGRFGPRVTALLCYRNRRAVEGSRDVWARLARMKRAERFELRRAA